MSTFILFFLVVVIVVVGFVLKYKHNSYVESQREGVGTEVNTKPTQDNQTQIT